MTAASRRGPGLLCVGMPKCGTSTLHALLEGVPPFFVPPVKEINYFVYDKAGYRGAWRDLAFSGNWIAEQERRTIGGAFKRMLTGRGGAAAAPWLIRYLLGRRDDAWYLSLFPADRIGVDASPFYHSLDRPGIARVRALAPDARVVILFRSPVEQLWSHCRMVVVGQMGEASTEAFRRHLDYQIDLRRSYRELVEDWSAAYRDRVLVGDMADMTADPEAFLARVLTFFDLDPALAPAAPRRRGAHVNRGVAHDVPPALRPALARAARIRLEGFAALDPAKAAAWAADVDAFEAAATPEGGGALS